MYSYLNKNVLKILSFILVVVVFILQGMDLSDEGYLLSLYKFANLKEIYEVNMFYLGTILFGGLMFKLGISNFVIFRGLNFLIILFSYYLFVIISKGKKNVDYFILYMVFIVGAMFSIVHYNTLSILFLGLTWYSLQGLKRCNLFFAGFFSVIFLVVKINNAIFFPLILFYVWWFNRKSIYQFFLGCVFSILLILIVIDNLIGFNEFSDAFVSHLNILSNYRTADYTALRILKVYSKDWLYVVFLTPAIYIAEIFGFRLIRIRYLLFLLLAIASFLIFPQLILYSLTFYAILALWKYDKITIIELISNLSILILLPLGSAGGLESVAYCSLIPGFVLISSRFDKILLSQFSKHGEKILFLSRNAIFTIAFFVLVYSDAWFDGPRYKLTELVTVNNNYFVTTPKKAKIIKDLNGYLRSYGLSSNDETLFFESTPLFYYLFDLKPQFGQPWIHISPPSYLRMCLENDTNIKMVVRFKGQPMGGSWENEDKAVSDTFALKSFARNPEHLKVLYGFLKRRNFYLAKNHELFEVWKLQ